MTKNAAKISEGIRALTYRPYEIISGTVVAGSVDAADGTFSLQPTDNGEPIVGVLLNPVSGNGNGLMLYPKDGSNVVIGSIDGPGEWVLLKASDVTKALITVENVTVEMDANQVNIQNGSQVFNIGASVFKLNSTSESLYQLLNDLITGITVLTVGTGSGPSTVPANVATFNSLLTRLGNLLSA